MVFVAIMGTSSYCDLRRAGAVLNTAPGSEAELADRRSRPASDRADVDPVFRSSLAASLMRCGGIDDREADPGRSDRQVSRQCEPREPRLARRTAPDDP